tara:strand:- start:952 stop:1317 length:366 start_codon:yes stop_codon:yes gene_type:complete
LIFLNKVFLNKKHISGTVSEYKAVNKLLELGFLVFKNVSSHGFIDVIAISPDDETFRIDIKTASRRVSDKTMSVGYYRRSGEIIYRVPSSEQKKYNVVLLIVDRDKFKIMPTRSKLAKWFG